MQNDEVYLMPIAGARWAISREIEGRWISLIQDTPLENKRDALVVLRALGIPASRAASIQYFPLRRGRRCPTHALLEMCNTLDPTNPVHKKKHECGV